jgi:hypothetical protein
MMVICINNGVSVDGISTSTAELLTIGKVYMVIDEYETVSPSKRGYYSILDDAGQKYDYFKKRFVLLEDVREDKLNSILG